MLDLAGNLCGFSVIVQNDAYIATHANDGAFAVGGTLFDATPTQSGYVTGHSFLGNLDTSSSTVSGRRLQGGITPGTNWLFNNGYTLGPIPFDWSALEFLAKVLIPTPTAAMLPRVVKACHGGRYDISMVPPSPNGGPNPTGWDTLFVFETHYDITIGKAADGRAFGASILAPFANVILEDDVQYVDGFIVAKSLTMSSGGGSAQIHAHCFQGANPMGSATSLASVQCGPSDGHISTCSTHAGSGGLMMGCHDLWSAKKCGRKVAKGKCHKKKPKRQCPLSCTGCQNMPSTGSAPGVAPAVYTPFVPIIG